MKEVTRPTITKVTAFPVLLEKSKISQNNGFFRITLVFQHES